METPIPLSSAFIAELRSKCTQSTDQSQLENNFQNGVRTPPPGGTATQAMKRDLHGHTKHESVQIQMILSSEMQESDYWSTAREPWPSLLFILPFLIVYEVGAIVHAHVPASRNGADLWIRNFGMETGVLVEWLFPLLAPILLLIWQFGWRRPWTWNLETLSGMFAESLLFAMLLVVMGQITALAFPLEIPQPLSVTPLARAVSFLGAGIYEEMLFRLAMLPAVFGGMRLLRIPKLPAMTGSVLISSWLFATAHYVNSPALFAPQELSDAMLTVSEHPELWFSFTFRFLAGILFSVLFWIRGFGIAVGCHILYDLFVGIILAGVG